MASESGNTRSPSTLVVLLVFTLMVPMAYASVLAPGGTLTPISITPSGPVMASIMNQPLATLTFTGKYSTWVVSDPTNPFCVGCLDFVYVFTDFGPDVNQRFTMYNFSGFNIIAGTNPFGVHDPINVSRSMLGGGAVISFNYNNFGDEIVPGETTPQLVIQTDARYWKNGLLSAQDGQAANGPAFQPLPEPGSLALLGGGLLAVGRFLRKARAGK